MKIYCSRHNYENELDRYVVKDVWIKVIPKQTCTGDALWIKIVTADEYNYYTNTVSDGYVSEPHGWKNVIYYMEILDSIPKDFYDVVHPIELLTTDEIKALIMGQVVSNHED